MNRKAQITLEAILVIIIFVAGWLAMQGYFKRAIQGQWQGNADAFSDEQYDPEESIVDYNREIGPAIVFKGSNLSADIALDQGNLLNVPDEFIKINNWGRYD